MRPLNDETETGVSLGRPACKKHQTKMGPGSKRQATARQRGTDSTEQPDFRGC